MNVREELIQMGWEVLISIDSPVGHWGKWMIEIRHPKDGRLIATYGNNEIEAFGEALTRAKQY